MYFRVVLLVRAMMQRRLFIAGGMIGALAVAGYFLWIYFTRQHGLPDWIARGNGRIEMTRTDVAVKYPGRLLSLTVHEGDLVHAGEIIAEQDDSDALAQLAGAQASRERAMGALARAEGERSAHASQAELAQLNWTQSADLHRRDMVSDVELRQRSLALAGAREGVTAAAGGVGEARGALAQAEAQVRQANTMLDDLRIRAPGPGRVEYRIVEPGTMMAPGGKLVSVVDPDDVYLTIFLPAAVASRVEIGDEARVVPQGLSTALAARISFVSPDAQFTPKFVETSNERDNLSYRVKLQIPADVARRFAGVLKAGMTADGYVRTDRNRPWPSLVTSGR